jgi:hypothetical protein
MKSLFGTMTGGAIRKPTLRTVVQHSDFSYLRWYLGITMACCWAWLFYLLYGALR